MGDIPDILRFWLLSLVQNHLLIVQAPPFSKTTKAAFQVVYEGSRRVCLLAFGIDACAKADVMVHGGLLICLVGEV